MQGYTAWLVLIGLIGFVAYLYGFHRGYRCFYYQIEKRDLKTGFLVDSIRRFNVRPIPSQMKREPDTLFWMKLFRETVSRLQEKKEIQLVNFLERYSATPEKALRKLNIISITDLDRDFPK
jgi:hypothetical protein